MVCLDVETHEPEVLRGFSLAKWRPRVLLIEDDMRLAGMLSDYLGAEGFAISHAPSGRAGLKLHGGEADAFDVAGHAK